MHLYSSEEAITLLCYGNKWTRKSSDFTHQKFIAHLRHSSNRSRWGILLYKPPRDPAGRGTILSTTGCHRREERLETLTSVAPSSPKSDAGHLHSHHTGHNWSHSFSSSGSWWEVPENKGNTGEHHCLYYTQSSVNYFTFLHLSCSSVTWGYSWSPSRGYGGNQMR